MPMVKAVGINGFGRIGRAIFRIVLEKEPFDVLVINDINPDNKNLAYQLKYDSLWGTLQADVSSDESGLTVSGKKIFVYHEKNIDKVPWDEHGVERVIDASGVHNNLLKARELKGKVKNIIITHAPEDELIDRSVIMGINEKDIDVKNDLIISNSICDANAIGPVLNVLQEHYGVESGFVTTLHPWLSYQNLLDGSSPSFAYPGHIYPHYVLGRASPLALLPKPTTAITAACKVMKDLKGKFYSFSYRVPTPAVSSSDMTIKLSKKTTVEELKCLFEAEEKKQKFKIFHCNTEPLVSVDFKGMEYSCIVDFRWLSVIDGTYAKIILWYDNEWGYSSRAIDLVSYLFSLD